MSIEAEMDHFGLFTNDLEKTIAWYNKFLGFKVSDYLPPGNEKEALVAPDGISWMRYSSLHHDLTLVQLPFKKNISVSDKNKSYIVLEVFDFGNILPSSSAIITTRFFSNQFIVC